ncbi:MAG: hypothetical protein P4L77_10580 [Sulfuriferula sp.]|nr:hypothetical protein [Sulfuriferula sp.]
MQRRLDQLVFDAKVTGFKISGGRVVDPMADAVATEAMLVDAESMLVAAFEADVALAAELGFNARVDRVIDPLNARHAKVEVIVWRKRNEDGGYDG